MDTKRLKELRESKQLSQKDMAKILGLQYQRYNHYETGRNEPDNNMLITIANFFKVSVDYLLGNKPDNTPPKEMMYMYPVIGTICAGYGNNLEETYTGEEEAIPEFMLRGNKEDYFVLRVSGDSMTPLYQEGDCVLMHRTNLVDSGQTTAVIIGDGEATLKRVIYDEKRTFITLEALNPHYSPRTFHREEMNDIRIVGEVKRLLRNVY